MPANRTPEEAAINARAQEMVHELGAGLTGDAKRLKQALTALVQVKRAAMPAEEAVQHLEAAWECIADQDGETRNKPL